LALLLGVVIGFTLGWLLVLALKRPRKVKVPTEIEFWVYLPSAEMPTQNEVMGDLAQTPALTPQDLLLLSDIRLHVALALKEKNLEQFRPDLLDSYVEPSAETLQAISESKALARVRFTSETPMLDDRHLRLVPYYAYAIARRTGAKAVLDVSASRLMQVTDLEALLKSDRRLAEPLSQVRIIWLTDELGGTVSTRGFGKRGWPELRTLPIQPDQRILVLQLFEEAVRQLWPLAAIPATISLEAYGDEFSLFINPPERGIHPVRIGRMHQQ